MSTNPTAINSFENSPVSIVVNTYNNKRDQLDSYVKFLAEQFAAQQNRVVTVTTDTGVSSTATPPARPTDVKTEASGGTVKDSDRKPDGSESGASAIASSGLYGTADGSDEAKTPGIFSNISTEINSIKKGAARALGGIIPSMEALLMNVPSNLLGKFVQGLPAAFQSLMPTGALSGIVGSVVSAVAGGGAISLNNLISAVSGGVIGSAAGQALRSVTNGIGIPAVSGLAGSLGAVALTRVAQASTAAIPLNLATGTNPFATAGSTPQASAVLATVTGSAGAAAFRGITQGIPVNPNLLGLAANVSLQGIGQQLNLPTPVLGLASNFASSAISSLTSNVISRIPILPTNLSLPITGSLSGIAQNISADIAQRLIPPGQLQEFLPKNLKKNIPRKVPRIDAPYVQNKVGVNRGQVREVYPANGPRSPIEERKSTLGALQGSKLTGQEKISENYIVADMSTRTTVTNLGGIIRGKDGLSPAQLYENMKFTGENILEVVRKEFPGFNVTSGVRNANNNSNHNLGLAVDLQWGTDNNFSSMAQRANRLYKIIPSLEELLLESYGTGPYWLHCAVRQGATKPRYVATCYAPGGTIVKSIPYSDSTGFRKDF